MSCFLAPGMSIFDRKVEGGHDDEIIREALRNHSSWGARLAALVSGEDVTVVVTVDVNGKPTRTRIKGGSIKISRSVMSRCGNFLKFHIVGHQDRVLETLGVADAYRLPRGFSVVLDTRTSRIVGMGTFYRKFPNDSRNINAAKWKVAFTGVDRVSIFIKYSGSTGIVTILEDGSWSVSSKNSGNMAGDDSYARRIAEIFAMDTAIDGKIAALHAKGVTSFGVEAFLASDQSHGYGYAQSGFIVTCMTRGYEATGFPIYLSPLELCSTCGEVGLPTDEPLIIEGEVRIAEVMATLGECRNFLTLSRLLELFPGMKTLHASLVAGLNVEGFVIRRWRNGEELQSVKYKGWLYQMVTQVLRPCLRDAANSLEFTAGLTSLKNPDGTFTATFLDAVERQMGAWVVTDDPVVKSICRWVVYRAAARCLPPGHPQLTWEKGSPYPADAAIPEGALPRDPDVAYWITLMTPAVAELQSAMDEVAWHPERCPLRADRLFPVLDAPQAEFNPALKTVLMLMGIPGIGKSMLEMLEVLFGPRVVYYSTQDQCNCKRGLFVDTLRKKLNLSAPHRVVVADRSNHTVDGRAQLLSEMRGVTHKGKPQPQLPFQHAVIDFVGNQLKRVAQVAESRVRSRAYHVGGLDSSNEKIGDVFASLPRKLPAAD